MDQDDRQSLWRRVARWIAGEGDSGDAPLPPGIRSDVRDIWEWTGSSESDAPRWNADEGWSDLRDRIGGDEEHPSVPDDGDSGRTVGLRRSRIQGGGWARVAAALAAVLLGGGALYFSQFDSSPPETQREVFRTDRAERLEIRLPDGSQVELGPESELAVPDGYQRGTRRVHLRGLGFFDVRAGPDARFIVRTSRGRATALGTRFSVRSFAEESVEKVVVGEGRVRMAVGTSSDVVLRAGESGVLSADSGVSVRSIDSERELAWTSGRLVFDDVPLSQVSRTLRRWYGVEFEVASPELGERHFTGDFTEESVKQIADIIASSLGVSYEIRDSTVVFVQSE